jgi:hypothetical protein
MVPVETRKSDKQSIRSKGRGHDQETELKVLRKNTKTYRSS